MSFHLPGRLSHSADVFIRSLWWLLRAPCGFSYALVSQYACAADNCFPFWNDLCEPWILSDNLLTRSQFCSVLSVLGEPPGTVYGMLLRTNSAVLTPPFWPSGLWFCWDCTEVAASRAHKQNADGFNYLLMRLHYKTNNPETSKNIKRTIK